MKRDLKNTQNSYILKVLIILSNESNSFEEMMKVIGKVNHVIL